MIVFVINTLFMNDNQKKELQSAAFERLLKHLDERKDVQNIDLMNLAGFCRNCLSRWFREEGEKNGVSMSDLEAREHVYGMPYSEWKEKYSLHIDQRIGLINFSTIGRECPKEARERYFNWDKEKNERKMICEKIEENFPLLEASVGGEISIDIYPKGKNKSQVLDEIYGPVVFFGDRCEKGGNDYPIVKRLETEINKRNYTINNVSHFKETWEILKKI